MTTSQKSHLIGLLAQSYSATQALVDEIELDFVVYENPVWQVRDVIWHLAVWDQQVAKSILAFKDGGQYAIPKFDEDRFNNAAFQDGRQLSPEQLLKESAQARSEFEQAVKMFPDDHFRTEFLYPWGDESGDVTQVVKDMLEHDEEHRTEILTAANR
jgi:hypothetical protein